MLSTHGRGVSIVRHVRFVGASEQAFEQMFGLYVASSAHRQYRSISYIICGTVVITMTKCIS